MPGLGLVDQDDGDDGEGGEEKAKAGDEAREADQDHDLVFSQLMSVVCI